MSDGEYEEREVEERGRSGRGEELAGNGTTSSNATAAPGGIPGETDDGLDELSGGTGSGGADSGDSEST